MLFLLGLIDKFQNEWIWKIYNFVFEIVDVNWIFLGFEFVLIMNSVSL